MRTQFVAAVAATGAVCAAVAGCGSEKATAPSANAPVTTTTAQPTAPANSVPPGAVGVSPSGVTTRVDVPSEATESQYGQACHAAREWMDAQRVDPRTLIEPYLKTLQAPGASNPGNFNTPWAKLSPAQQSGVIMAANQAARGECG